MKRIILLTFSFLAALALVTACARATPTPTEAPPTVEETTEVVTEAYPVETEVEIETEAYPVETETEVTDEMVDVEALIIDRCSACHPADRVFNADLTAEEWDETIDRMIDYGAELNDEEKDLMIDWLTSPEN